MKLNWQNVEDIAIVLCEKYPHQDPLKLRFTELLDQIISIENFEGKREESNEAKLESIQMAWLEEWKDSH